MKNLYDYFPYGKVLRQYQNSGQERYLFSRQERDNTGYDFFKYRQYDSDIIRFLGVDPLAQSYPSLTTYQYAGLSPILHIDVEGLEKTPWWNGTVLDNDRMERDPLGAVSNTLSLLNPFNYNIIVSGESGGSEKSPPIDPSKKDVWLNIEVLQILIDVSGKKKPSKQTANEAMNETKAKGKTTQNETQKKAEEKATGGNERTKNIVEKVAEASNEKGNVINAIIGPKGDTLMQVTQEKSKSHKNDTVIYRVEQ